MVFPYRRFVTTYRSHLFLDSWSLKKLPKGCPGTTVRNYHSTLRKNPKRADRIYVVAEASNRPPFQRMTRVIDTDKRSTWSAERTSPNSSAKPITTCWGLCLTVLRVNSRYLWSVILTSYEQLAVELIRIEVIWDIALCKVENGYRRFEGS